MRNFALVFVLSGVFATTARAVATISFDQLQVGEDVLNYYNGGFGNMGSGPGPSAGVIFSPGWIAGPPDTYGTPGGKSAAISGTAIVNVPAGWFGPTSFYYLGGPLTVNFYSQQNGLGSSLGTLNSPEESNFFATGLSIPLFQSAVFLAPNGDRIDALTNGAFVVPEPGTVQLLLLAAGFSRLIALRLKTRVCRGTRSSAGPGDRRGRGLSTYDHKLLKYATSAFISSAGRSSDCIPPAIILGVGDLSRWMR